MVKDIEAVFEGKLEPGVYRLDPSAPADELDRLSKEHGFSLFYLDGSKVSDGAAFRREVAGAMGFPSYFGHNWNALLDCLRDMGWSPAKGYVVLYDGFEAFAQGDPRGWEVAQDVFRSAIGFWKERMGAPMYLLLRPKSAVAAR